MGSQVGPRLVTPEMMPPANAELDDLPAAYQAAALDAISVNGYCQPAIEKPKRKRRYTDEQRAVLAKRLRETNPRLRNRP
jgi:hypothetical protein